MGKKIVGLLIIILAVHVLATVNHWYWTVWWFDIPMHLAGGFWVGLLFLWLFKESQYLSEFKLNKNFLAFIFLLSFTAFVGVFWEFFEFLYDAFIARKVYAAQFFQDGTADTMKDLANDLIGGMLAFLLRKKSD